MSKNHIVPNTDTYRSYCGRNVFHLKSTYLKDVSRIKAHDKDLCITCYNASPVLPCNNCNSLFQDNNSWGICENCRSKI